MKENSIEEDIKNIEEIIELSKEEIDAKDENITAILDIEDLMSLEHILSDYKRVLKENEELKNQEATARKINELLVERYSNSIQVQKVKDKIEKLNQYYKKEIYPSLYQWGDITITEHYDEMIELLQEIIGDK